MAEQRKHDRKYMTNYLRVIDRNTEKLVGNLVDITTEGCMLISDDPIETGVDFELKLDLPEEIRGSRQITFDAHSRWCKSDVNPEFYDSGFRLSNISTNDIAIIESLIQDFVFRANEAEAALRRHVGAQRQTGELLPTPRSV